MPVYFSLPTGTICYYFRFMTRTELGSSSVNTSTFLWNLENSYHVPLSHITFNSELTPQHIAALCFEIPTPWFQSCKSGGNTESLLMVFSECYD